MRLTIICLTLFSINLSVYGSTLKEVLTYAIENGPQFKESEFYTKAQLESLNKVVAVYDTYLNGTFKDYIQDSTLGTGEDDGTISSLAISKNIGLGATLGVQAGSTEIKSTQEKYETNLKFTAQINLLKNFLGTIDRNSVLVSEKKKDILNLTLKQSRETLVYGVVVAYIDLLRLEQLIVENKELLKNIINLENATKKKRRIGASEERHVLQMSAKRVDREMMILELERQLQISKDALKVLAGGKQFQNLEPIMFNDFLSRTPNDLTMEKLKIENQALEMDLKSARSNYLPDLKLEFGYGEDNTNNESMKYFEDMNESEKYFMVTLSMPLEFRAERATKKAAIYSLMENQNKQQKQKLEFQKKLNEFRRSIENYEKQVVMSKKIKELQEKRYNLEERAYNQGRSGINDINTAQNDLISAKISAVEKLTALHKFGVGNLHLNNHLENYILGK